ncbi:MAG: SDR family oxidoreductase [Dehalococcoidia bacterium]|nr:SDR family oxidoreductase [Dehalococcoidia bacterium]
MVLEKLRLDGPPRRVAIVTGGGRGLGREMALALSEAGADVCIASRTQSQLDATADFIAERSGRRPLTVSMDVREREQCDALIEQTVTHFGRLDILMNNAGIGDARGGGTQVDQLSDDDWADAIAVNLNSAFYCSRAAVRVFRKQDQGGVIVNVASGTAMRMYPMGLGYASAKGAVMSMTRSLAAQVVGDGIRVNGIVPGFILQSPPETEEQREQAAQRGRFNSTGRLGEAWELGPLAVFLCSDASAYITGEHFVIDGGGMAGGIAPTGWPAPGVTV